ncbi:MAG: hypothetical protein K1X72_04215 [Pyrinomonadaceae bacterium]|nr:hypothetical protein [Pyrinomonadaceae bacterium]
MAETQTYQNHVRWYPLVHFVIFPLLLFNLIWQIVMFYQERTWDRAEWVLMALVFAAMNVAARLQALKAQDRVIRLEESLRFKDVLSKDLAQKVEQLRTSQLIALRFASDEELPDLVQKVLNGELKETKEIKLAIKNWRGDYLRV